MHLSRDHQEVIELLHGIVDDLKAPGHAASGQDHWILAFDYGAGVMFIDESMSNADLTALPWATPLAIAVPGKPAPEHMQIPLILDDEGNVAQLVRRSEAMDKLKRNLGALAHAAM